LLTIADQEQPPRRFIGGADAIGIAEQKAKDLQEQAKLQRPVDRTCSGGCIAMRVHEEGQRRRKS
jgi:hypothetical protein